MEVGALESVVNCLNIHVSKQIQNIATTNANMVKEKAVAHASTLAISNLISCPEITQQRIIRCNVIQAVVSAIQINSSDAKVVEAGCWALLHLVTLTDYHIRKNHIPINTVKMLRDIVKDDNLPSSSKTYAKRAIDILTA
jgi:hypothetical protein